MNLDSDLRFSLPLMRGEQVRAAQQALIRRGLLRCGADGVYGPATRDAVRDFQQAEKLEADGVIGRDTWSRLNPDSAAIVDDAPAAAAVRALADVRTPGAADAPAPAAAPAASAPAPGWIANLDAYLRRIADWHASPLGGGTLQWRLAADGVRVREAGAERLPRTGGAPNTARKVWTAYGAALQKCAAAYGVPVEIIVATICTESGGRADCCREEPGFVSDATTPDRVSPGLMQTLISTARAAVGDPRLDRQALLDPETSIRAGTLYLRQQALRRAGPTNFDPPLVACAYNAGSLRPAGNRWGLVQTLRDKQLGTLHADAWIEYFNDCFAVLGEAPPLANTPSYWRLLNPPA
ncbi:peptidoglycan-binding protein [Derxia lacustris]|uniref:peptidoglycan-binding protein n=1 Tax=Derxia lacustris TaxID=764842 RepID=UPI001594D94A|nr:peptidoglycan-binding protein [Derxia lacustris]